MKRFVAYIGIYIAVILLVIFPPELYRMHFGCELRGVPGGEVRAAVKTSKNKIGKRVKKLIVGDSTGHSLYPSENTFDTIVSMASNKAITMAGQYFLLMNYLETNADNLPEEIVLLYTPRSFENDVDKYAYQYFLKPFPYKEYKALYTPHLAERIRTIPLYWTANWPFIQTSGYTPRFAVPKNEEKAYLSRVSIEYLLKIDSITTEYGIPYSMYSTPIRDDAKQETEARIEGIRCAVPASLESHFETFIESIEYYPSEQFFDDVHLKSDYVPEDYLARFNK